MSERSERSANLVDDSAVFEELVGGPERGFRLMRMYETAKQTVSGDHYELWRFGRERKPEAVLRPRALAEGYTHEQIDAFLRLQ